MDKGHGQVFLSFEKYHFLYLVFLVLVCFVKCLKFYIALHGLGSVWLNVYVISPVSFFSILPIIHHLKVILSDVFQLRSVHKEKLFVIYFIIIQSNTCSRLYIDIYEIPTLANNFLCVSLKSVSSPQI